MNIETLSQRDLTENQVRETIKNYCLAASLYAKSEWDPAAVSKAQREITEPFGNKLPPRSPERILYLGSGSGRNTTLIQKLFPIAKHVAVDVCKPLLDEARARRVSAEHIQADLRQLPLGLQTPFSGVVAESAFSHIPKKDLVPALTSLYAIMQTEGVLLLGFRLGTGECYRTINDIGERYYTTVSQSEAVGFLTQSRFQIIDLQIRSHIYPERPKFLNLFAQKVYA